MKFSCIHTHTNFCDGKDDVETMCRAAAEKGLVSIGFSSHAPVGRKTGLGPDQWHLAEERLDEYISEVHAAKKRWEGRLEVYLGLEIDFVAGRCGPADADFQALPLDYIIGAVHYVASPKNGEFMSVDSPLDYFKPDFERLFDNDGESLIRAYFEAYKAMLKAGGWDIAGHLDLVKRNNGIFPFFSPESPLYSGLLLETAALAAETAAAANAVIEVNTGGMNRGSISEPYPSPAALKRLGELNAPLLISADAHRGEDLDGHYEDAVSAMIAAGYRETFIFAGPGRGWKKLSILP